MGMDAATRAKGLQYESTVVEYAMKSNGHFIVLSDDQSFTTLLRLTLQKELGLVSPGLLTPVVTAGNLLRVVSETTTRHPTPVLLLEQVMGGRDFSFMVQQLKSAYPNLKIIVLTNGVERERLMFLHEIGADNFIAKPMSANTLIEKLAFTLKPQGKLGQLIDLARQKVRDNDPSGALMICNQVLEVKPNSAAGYLIMGDAYLAMKNTEEAKDAYLTASQHAELFLEPLRRLADLYGSIGDIQGRLRYLQRLDALSPLNVDRKIDMGEIHLGLGHESEAAVLFSTAMQQVARDAASQISAISTRIADMYAESDPAEAERYLRAGLETKGSYLSREDIQIFNRLGISLRQQGRWKDALAEYQKAIKIAPDDENLYYNMGMACAEGKDFTNARLHILKALELNPDLISSSHNIAYNMGAVFVQANSRERGIQCLKLALELNPEFGPAKRALATLGR
ncbi:MAG: tetratricopeptide repeat protein [Bilophila sp.]